MKHWIITGLMGVSLLGTTTNAVAANDFHLVLNGFSQEVHASDGYTGILGTSGRTLSWWYRSHVNSFPTWGLVFWGFRWAVQLEPTDSGSINLEVQGAKIAWSAQRNPAMASLQDGQWHQLVMTAPEAGTLEDVRLYLDGSLVPVVSVVNGSLTRTYDTLQCCTFRLGARDLGNHADADMDELGLWNVELTAAAVAETFNGGIPMDLTQNGSSYTSAGNLQLYWRFEEGSGLTTADLSGNGHDGVIIAGDSVDSWGTNPPGSGSDSDGDGILDGFDNCPIQFNPDQEDADLDEIGDVCDPFPDDPDNDQAQCEADLDECLNPPTPTTQCSDGIDNDGDGAIDLEDRQCKNPEQDSEKHPNR